MKAYLTIVTLVLLSYLGYGQNYTEQDLDKLNVQGLQCDSLGRASLEKLSTYYYYQGNHPMTCHYVHKQIECTLNTWDGKSATIKDSINALNSYYRLLTYHQVASGKDSVQYAADLLLDFLGDNNNYYAKQIRTNVNRQLGLHFYYDHDEIGKAYSHFKKSSALALESKFYHIYLETISNIVIFEIDEGECDKAIKTANEALAKLPDHLDPLDSLEFRRTDIRALEICIGNLEFYKAEALLTKKDKDLDETNSAYATILAELKTAEIRNRPYRQVSIMSLILEHLDGHLPLDTLLYYGDRGVALENSFSKQDADIYYSHATNLIKAGQYKKAQELLNTSLNLSKKETNRYSQLANIHDALSVVHMNLGDITQARENIELFKIYNDSLYHRKTRTSVYAVETKYLLSVKEAENLKISQEAELLNAKLKLYATLGFFLVSSMLLFLGLYIQKRRSTTKLTKLVKEKDRIFTILAHDLRNPLASLSNLTSKIDFLIKKNRIPEVMDIARHTESKVIALNDNLNSILSWAYLENGILSNNPELISISNEIDSLITLISNETQDRTIEFRNTIDQGSIIKCDRKILQTIVRNGLSNAAKFCANNGKVIVKMSQSLDRHIIEITNNYDQNMERNKSRVGTGVGLKVAEELSKIAGFDISLNINDSGLTNFKIVT